MLTDPWTVQAGGSYTLARNELEFTQTIIDNTENSAHLKVKLKKRFSSRLKLALGAEQFITDFDEDFGGTFDGQLTNFSYGFKSNITAAFAESDIIFSKKLALKVGLRGNYTDVLEQVTLSPRASFAYKTGKNSQLSIAYGDFYQNPGNDFLKFSQDFEAQKTQHYIANYQYSNNGRIFRAEAFRKEYSSLVTFDTDFASFDSEYGNNGSGFAQGLDIFWRDNTSVKNMDYWVSYSLLDSERQYLNYPEQARAPFANTHNISVVLENPFRLL